MPGRVSIQGKTGRVLDVGIVDYTIVNNISVNDTAAHFSDPLTADELALYPRLSIYVIDNHDQSMDLTLFQAGGTMGGDAIRNFSGTTIEVSTDNGTVSSDRFVGVGTGSDWEDVWRIIPHPFAEGLQIRYKATTTAPTSGSITIIIRALSN